MYLYKCDAFSNIIWSNSSIVFGAATHKICVECIKYVANLRNNIATISFYILSIIWNYQHNLKIKSFHKNSMKSIWETSIHLYASTCGSICLINSMATHCSLLRVYLARHITAVYRGLRKVHDNRSMRFIIQ